MTLPLPSVLLAAAALQSIETQGPAVIRGGHGPRKMITKAERDERNRKKKLAEKSRANNRKKGRK